MGEFPKSTVLTLEVEESLERGDNQLDAKPGQVKDGGHCSRNRQ